VESDSGRNNNDAPTAFLRSHANIHIFDAKKIASVPPDISYDFMSTEDHCSSSPVAVEQFTETRVVGATIL
jgi:hypothetical protein